MIAASPELLKKRWLSNLGIQLQKGDNAVSQVTPHKAATSKQSDAIRDQAKGNKHRTQQRVTHVNSYTDKGNTHSGIPFPFLRYLTKYALEVTFTT